MSGGGSLAPRLDTFFEAAKVPVLNGWGLTETSPVVACRRVDAHGTDATLNVRGTVGFEIPGTKVRCAQPLTAVIFDLLCKPCLVACAHLYTCVALCGLQRKHRVMKGLMSL